MPACLCDFVHLGWFIHIKWFSAFIILGGAILPWIYSLCILIFIFTNVNWCFFTSITVGASSFHLPSYFWALGLQLWLIFNSMPSARSCLFLQLSQPALLRLYPKLNWLVTMLDFFVPLICIHVTSKGKKDMHACMYVCVSVFYV